MVFSVVFCFITKMNMKNKINGDNVQGFFWGHIVALSLLIVSALFTILGMVFAGIIVILIDAIINVLIAMWHIRLIKKLAVMKDEFIKNSVCYCNSCGSAHPEGTEFCTQCGAQIIPIKEDTE